MKLNELKKQPKQSKLSPLYLLEHKTNLKPLIVFTVITAVLVFLTVSMFTLIEPLMQDLGGLFTDDPAIQEALLGQTIGSYFVSEVGQLWALMGTIYASFLGYKLINGNFKNGSFEVLYTQNVSRSQIVKHKLIRMLINLAVFNVVCGLVGLVAMLIWGAGEFSVLNYFGYMLFIIILTLQVGAISFSLSLFGKRKYSTFLSILVVLVFYFLATLGLLGDGFEVFNYLTPFAVAFADVINAGFSAVNYVSLSIWTVVSVVASVLGIRYYKNTDLV